MAWWQKKTDKTGSSDKISLFFILFYWTYIFSRKSENLYREKFHTPSLSTLSRRRIDGEKFAYLHRSTRPVCHWRKSNCKMASFCSKLLSPRSCHRRRKLPQHANIGENWYWAHTFRSPPSQVKDEQCRCRTMKGNLTHGLQSTHQRTKVERWGAIIQSEKRKEMGSSRKEQVCSFYIRREDTVRPNKAESDFKKSICIQFEHLHVVVISCVRR